MAGSTHGVQEANRDTVPVSVVPGHDHYSAGIHVLVSRDVMGVHSPCTVFDRIGRDVCSGMRLTLFMPLIVFVNL